MSIAISTFNLLFNFDLFFCTILFHLRGSRLHSFRLSGFVATDHQNISCWNIACVQSLSNMSSMSSIDDVMMGASQLAGSAFQAVGSYAGISGMVAERGLAGTRIPSGFYGGVATASGLSSRSTTPPHVPPGRHKSRGLFDRSTSPRPRSRNPLEPSSGRRLPQLTLEAHDAEAEFMRRIDRFESELRRNAQQMAVESHHAKKLP